MMKLRMYLTLIALVGLVIVLGCSSEQSEQFASTAPYLTDFEMAKAQASDKNQNALVDFYTDW